ncbi:MAG: hypothetical protein EA351_01035 [Gemmatimonadales bacterium]|nr:MAG: hypothetical protein EA351_01035 [Gemmatimonadales bacterium]
MPRSAARPARPLPGGPDLLRLSPLDFLQALSRLIPPPRVHHHCYHGVLAPNAHACESGSSTLAADACADAESPSVQDAAPPGSHAEPSPPSPLSTPEPAFHRRPLPLGPAHRPHLRGGASRLPRLRRRDAHPPSSSPTPPPSRRPLKKYGAPPLGAPWGQLVGGSSKLSHSLW